jgi:hypothetical protein
LSRKSRKTTRDLKPAPWGGFGYTRTRKYQIPSRIATRTPNVTPVKLEAAFLRIFAMGLATGQLYARSVVSPIEAPKRS